MMRWVYAHFFKIIYGWFEFIYLLIFSLSAGSTFNMPCNKASPHGKFRQSRQHNISRTIMVPLFSAQKSSANYLAPRVFAQKGFDISNFGHFFCPIPEIFSTLVQSFSTK